MEGREKVMAERGVALVSSGLQVHKPYSPKASTQQVTGPGASPLLQNA